MKYHSNNDHKRVFCETVPCKLYQTIKCLLVQSLMKVHSGNSAWDRHQFLWRKTSCRSIVAYSIRVTVMAWETLWRYSWANPWSRAFYLFIYLFYSSNHISNQNQYLKYTNKQCGLNGEHRDKPLTCTCRHSGKFISTRTVITIHARTKLITCLK